MLSNHADIEGTKNNAIEHFQHVESFRDEQKICLNLVRRGQDVFAILPTGSGRETLIFLNSFQALSVNAFRYLKRTAGRRLDNLGVRILEHF